MDAMVSVGLICLGCLLCLVITRTSRFFGSTSAIGFALVRYIRWWEAFSWLNCPLVLWSVVMFFLFEILYGALFYSVKRQEERSQCGIKHKER